MPDLKANRIFDLCRDPKRCHRSGSRSDLVSVRDNIEKQIEALSIIEDSKSAYMASTPIITQETIMANTYRIEEEVTTGWTLISDQTENLSKEKAKEIINEISKIHNVKKGILMKSLRVAFFGSLSGPDLIQSWELFSENKSDIFRIERCL